MPRVCTQSDAQSNELAGCNVGEINHYAINYDERSGITVAVKLSSSTRNTLTRLHERCLLV